MTNAARDLGLVLSNEQIQNADKTADKLSEVKQVLEARIAGVVSDNADAIFKLAGALEYLIGKAGDAVVAYSNFTNLRAFHGGDESAAITLAHSASGRAALVEDTDARLAQNSRDRAGRRKRTDTFWGQLTAPGDAASDKKLDEQFKSLTRFRNSVIQLDTRVTEQAARKAAAPGDGPLPTAKGGASKGGASRKAPRDRTAQKEEAYERELASIQSEELGIRAGMSNDLRERAEYERRRIETEKAAFDYDNDLKVSTGQRSAVQGRALKLAEEDLYDQQKRQINWHLDDDLLREQLKVKAASLGVQSDLLHGELDSAKTAKERRALELKLLDIEYDPQRAALKAVLAMHDSTENQKKIAQERLDQLDVLKGQARQKINDTEIGPLDAFRNDLHKTALQIDEDFQRIQVDGIKSLNDGLVDAIMNSKSLGDVFTKVANQIIADFIRMALQAAESDIFGSGSGSGGGFGGLLSFAGKALGLGGGSGSGGGVGAGFGAADLGFQGGGYMPGLATGGTIDIGGNSGVDRNVLSINGVPRARVSATEKISVTPANMRAAEPTIVQLVVGPGQVFVPAVTAISGNVSMQSVQQGAASMSRSRRQTLGRA